MFDQLALVFEDGTLEQPPRVRRRTERVREASARITYSRSVTARRRREAEAERTLARARRARIEAQKFREYVEQWRAHGGHSDGERFLRLMPPPANQE